MNYMSINLFKDNIQVLSMTNDSLSARKTQTVQSGEYVINVKGTYCNSVQAYFYQLGIGL